MSDQDGRDAAEAYKRILKHKGEFLIVGFTGRTGSGCSTAADIFCSDFANLKVPYPSRGSYPNHESRKERIVYEFCQNHWVPFHPIRVRSVITSFVLPHNGESLAREFAAHCASDGVTDVDIKFLAPKVDASLAKCRAAFDAAEAESDPQKKAEQLVQLYSGMLDEATKSIHQLMESVGGRLALTFYQKIGDNIRRSGNALSSLLEPDAFDSIPQRINQIIKSIHRVNKKLAKPTRIVIDAIRNPLEATFFRDRYSAFYLASVNCQNGDRLSRLSDINFTRTDISRIDQKECPRDRLKGVDRFTSQDIQSCVSMADLHLHNPNETSGLRVQLTKGLMRYYSLMQKPALINPSKLERVMQIAYGARANSGCISRQVGAVVTDNEMVVRGIGWNDVPMGQVPCVLRDVRDLEHDNVAFSCYERGNEFSGIVKQKRQALLNVVQIVPGWNPCYCFKDLQNKKDGEKNQVHTRALHAEENAMLQVAKYGGQPLENGHLFTTASPCELCSKKAYQLGIRKIHYVDPYPGITSAHVLASGTSAPELNLFEGALGRAYFRLYDPIMSYKDELEIFES